MAHLKEQKMNDPMRHDYELDEVSRKQKLAAAIQPVFCGGNYTLPVFGAQLLLCCSPLKTNEGR
jgi:hypothetical protein